MGQGAGATRAVSASGLPSFQQPHAERVLREGQRLYEGPGPTFFPRSTVAGLNEQEIQGRNHLSEMSGTIANMFGQGEPTHQALMFGLNAADVGNNRYARDAAQAAIDPIFQRLERHTLPDARQAAIGTGNYGGSRDQIYRSLVTNDAVREAHNATSSLYKDMYQQGLNTQTQTLGQLPAYTQNLLLPGQTLAAMGAQQRALDQSRIDEDVARHNFEQSMPYTRLMEYANLVNHPYGGQAESATEAVGGENSSVSNWLGAILGGIGLIPGVVNAFRRR